MHRRHLVSRSLVLAAGLAFGSMAWAQTTINVAAFAELKIVLDEREHEIATRTESLRNAVAELDRLSRTDASLSHATQHGQ